MAKAMSNISLTQQTNNHVCGYTSSVSSLIRASSGVDETEKRYRTVEAPILLGRSWLRVILEIVIEQ